MSAAATTSIDDDDAGGADDDGGLAERARRQDAELPRSVAGGRNPWLIAIVVSIATFMEVLDTSIANVALRYIGGDLAVSLDESTWVLTSYLVSNAIVLPISGWLANVFGRKRFYMACVALFTLSSLACGFAPNLATLVFFRILQGIGGGGLAPSEQSMLADTFKPSQRGAAFAIYGIAVVFAPAIGPVLGGYICDHYSWHWIFLINVPVGLTSLLLVHLLIVEPPAEKKDRKARVRRGINIDFIGFGLVAVGLGAMQVVLDRGERNDWFESSFIVVFTAMSVVALAILIPWELTRKQPIVNLRLYRSLGFVSSNVLMFALGFILLGTTQLLPQMVQELYGYTATDAGLVITPGGFAVMLLMPVVGFAVNKVQARYLVAFGMTIEFFALYHLSTFSLNVSYEQLAIARIFQAAGIAFLFIPITNAAYNGIPPEHSNDASAMVNLMRNLGGSFGISLAQAAILERGQFHRSRLVENASPTNPFYHDAVSRISTALTNGGLASAQATQAAIERIGSIIERQASILSYLEVFRVLAYIALGSVPLVFLLKKAKPGEVHQGH